MEYIDPNDKRYADQFNMTSNTNAPIAPYKTASSAALTAGNAAIANDPTINKGPIPDPYAARNALSSNFDTRGIVERVASLPVPQITGISPFGAPSSAPKRDIKTVGDVGNYVADGFSQIGSNAANYAYGAGTDAIANTVINAKDLISPYNPYNGVGYVAPKPVAPIVSGGLSKAANYSKPSDLPNTSPQIQMQGLNMPKFDYTKFQPNAVDVQGLAGQARDFGGQIDLTKFNAQLDGNMQGNASREDNFNAQINDIMGQLSQSKDDISKHIGSIGSAGSFSGILQAKLLAKDATARRSQLQGALAAILQQRVGANDSNRNNLQSIGLGATNAQATHTADFTQSLGKNILNNGIQKDINNNATQNDVAKTVAYEQFSSDAKSKQFDLAEKTRIEETRREFANAKPGSPESERLARKLAILAGGTGNVEPNVMKVKSLVRDSNGIVTGESEKIVNIGKNKNNGSVSVNTVYDPERENALQQVANRMAELNQKDKTDKLDKKEQGELAGLRDQMQMPRN